MKLYVFILTLLLLTPLLLQAQSNYKPGLVVTLEGDTVRGFINYREWANTPDAVSFREDVKNGPDKTIDLSNSRYFEITGYDAFQRYQGPITMNPVELDKISYDEANLDSLAQTRVEHVTVFLRVNYSGGLLDLLSYTDNIKTRFFYQEKDGSAPQELYYKVHYGLREGVRLRRPTGYSGPLLFLVTQKAYISQLQYLLTKLDVYTKKISSELETVHYSANDLENLFIKINELRVSNPASKIKKRTTTRVYAGLALHSSTLKVSGIRGFSDPDSNPVSYMPQVNFGFDAFLNRHIQRFYFRVEGSLTAARHHVEDERTFDPDTKKQSYKIARQSVAVSPQLIYTLYNKDNFKFNVGALARINLSHYSENTYNATTIYSAKYSSNPPADKLEEIKEFQKPMPLWLSFGMRAGIVLKQKYELTTTYIPFTAVTQHNTSALEYRSVFAGVNYLFGK